MLLLMLHLGDEILGCLGGKWHGRHGHHDGLVGGVNRSRGGLRARPNGGIVGGESGPCGLHLSPVKKLSRRKREREGGRGRELSRNRHRKRETKRKHVSVDIRQVTLGHRLLNLI